MSLLEINHPRLKKFIGDLDQDQRLFDHLFDVLKGYFANLRELGYDPDPHQMKKISMIAHKIKSSCNTFGAENLGAKLEALERASKMGKHQETQDLYNEVVQEFPKTLEVLLEASRKLLSP